MRVIDSSALVKYFSREENWEKVREIMLQGVISLDLAVKELANALWKKVRRGEMNFEVAKTILRDITEEKPIPIEYEEKYLSKAFEIAMENGLTIYDSLFIVFAMEKGLELVTCDENQARIAQKLGVKVLVL